MNSKSKAISTHFIEDSKKRFCSISIINLIIRIAWLLAKIVVGAMLFVALAHFVPELKEQVPSFYKLVEFILHIFEVFCSWFTSHM